MNIKLFLNTSFKFKPPAQQRKAAMESRPPLILRRQKHGLSSDNRWFTAWTFPLHIH